MSLRTSWLYRKLTRHVILITFNVDRDKQRASENLVFAKVSKAQAYSMGYVKGKKMKDKLRYATFPIYVKFVPELPPLVPYRYEGQTKIENRETSSTLFDHFKSNAIEKFLKGMTTKTSLAKIDQTKLLMLAAVVIGAIVGVYFILR